MPRMCERPGCRRQAMPRQRHCHVHVAVTRRTLYRVWAYLDQDILASVLQIARATGLASATVHAALMELDRRGVIKRYPRLSRARRLIEPFNWFDG